MEKISEKDVVEALERYFREQYREDLEREREEKEYQAKVDLRVRIAALEKDIRVSKGHCEAQLLELEVIKRLL